MRFFKTFATIGLWAALCYNGAAYGQLNESDTALLQLRASVSGNFQKGNVNLLLLRGYLEASVAPSKNWVLKSQNVSLYQAFFKTKADNDVLSRNFIYYRPYRRFYPFAIAYVSTNFRRQIAWRYFTGLGATAQILQAENHQLKASVGVVYEQSKFTSEMYNYGKYNGSNTINNWRATTWLWGKHRIWQNRLTGYYSMYWQPSFQDRYNYRLQADLGIELQVWKGLAFNAHYTYTLENVVAVKTAQTDQIVSFGLAYTARFDKRNPKP